MQDVGTDSTILLSIDLRWSYCAQFGTLNFIEVVKKSGQDPETNVNNDKGAGP